MPQRAAAPQTLREIRDAAERGAIAAALNRQANNLAAAARALGVWRVTLYRLIQRHGLRVPHESPTTH